MFVYDPNFLDFSIPAARTWAAWTGRGHLSRVYRTKGITRRSKTKKNLSECYRLIAIRSKHASIDIKPYLEGKQYGKSCTPVTQALSSTHMMRTSTGKHTRRTSKPILPPCLTLVQPKSTVKWRWYTRRLPKRPPVPFIFPPPGTSTRRHRHHTRCERKATKEKSDDDDDDNDEMEVPPVPPVVVWSESVVRMLMGSLDVLTPPSSPAPVREDTSALGLSSFPGSYFPQVDDEAKV
ncbi:uncharacterized protein BT62DRAFT_917164 [Guyanagaster necrorhizus]|uniref:Uncharacterized protein n=1 Tax=Guyanagaster necrorhizus TaxID=856835 RepID=A0A9P7W2Q9_9AGAR|nr:uncharacterized protein BT62DRAFT_917164 [Guyanagaster necrorhizus MCA 3950]KAG7450900.1 hypothetical protein BT62DRAFT_917164 [Guyanagaster necrorhizus MCA 3950]